MKSKFVRIRALVALVGLVFLSPMPLVADLHEFDTDKQRERYQKLVDELRCPKCQNQNLADSNSTIAVSLRNEVVRLVKEGESDKAIQEFMVNRYGDFVLYRPPLQGNTIMLWWAPVIMMGIGLLIFAGIVVRRSQVAEEVSDNEVAFEEGLELDSNDASDQSVEEQNGT